MEQEESGLRVFLKCSRHPSDTTLCQVISSCFPGMAATVGDMGLEHFGGITFPFGNEGEVVLSGECPTRSDLVKVLELLTQILTVCDDADVSHCLDIYRTPSEGLEPADWPYTEIGALVYRAKYQHDAPAARQLAAKLAATIASHPALRRVELVAAVPPSGSGRHFDAPAVWRGLIGGQFGFEEAELWRTRTVLEQKAITVREERARNQQNSMDCSGKVDGKARMLRTGGGGCPRQWWAAASEQF